MDKYEFNIKIEQLRKLVNKGDYETAMKIADTIDWKKVRNANLLSMVAQIYEKNEEYQEAKEILLLAFERAPIGKRLLYKLTELALKEGKTEEAEAYYREFCDLAGDDPRQQLLRYIILKEKGAPAEQLIHSLEGYTSQELDEKWLYELAELYHEVGNDPMCVSTCDKIMLMFGLGKYVDKAMELKIQHAPLTKYQMDLVENREKYEEKLRAVEQTYHGATGREEYVDVDALGEEGEEFSSIPGAPEPVDEVTEDPIPEPIEIEIPRSEYAQDTMVAEVKQAEVEERLAKELSKINVEEYEEDESEKTQVLGDLMRAQILTQETTVLPSVSQLLGRAEPLVVKTDMIEDEMEEEEDETEPLLPQMANHLMIEGRTPEKGLDMALETLKKIQGETGVKNPIAKISGSKLNKRGILNSMDKLTGKDLLVEEAGDLSLDMLEELELLMDQDESGMRIILIDNPKQMKMLHEQNPTLSEKFQCIGSGDGQSNGAPTKTAVKEDVDPRPVRHVKPVREPQPTLAAHKPQQDVAEAAAEDDEEMDIDEFAQYACKYASEIDCSVTGKSMLALYERIEIMEEDGILLTRANAEELIESAADQAENPSIGKLITGVFSSKYDKDGLLILKEEHFI